MNQRELTGYVIGRQRLRDSDLILTIFSSEIGKISVVAKGIKKPKAKLQAHIEPLVRTKFRIIGRGKIPTLVGAQGEEANSYYSLAPEQNMAALLLTEVVDMISVDEMPNEALFEAYSQALGLLKSQEKFWLHTTYGLLAILQSSGIAPQVSGTEQEKYFINLSEGTVQSKAEGHESLRVPTDVVKLWKICLQYDVNTVNRLQVDAKITRSSLDILVSYIQYHTYRKLKAAKVFFQSI